MEGSKTCCGYPRKRVLFCTVPAVLAIIASHHCQGDRAGSPDFIETPERTESDSTTAEELSILKTATLSSSEVSGTVPLLSVAAGNSSFVALNDFVINEACDEAEIRLQEKGFTSGTTSGVIVMPLTADTASAVELDFTEPLDENFAAVLHDQVRALCLKL
ncbi:unnamed protein product [Ectocarpus sp. CCAP 1310/34]|nr:unnamed protein product [Ectocarpus sp. CCAP 1310/34]